jgi:hypothetical protein
MPVFPSEETRGLKDFENPLYPINHFHMLAKRFIGAHGGYGRSHLQDWLNLLAYILNPPFSRIMKVRNLPMAVFRRRRMKYLDVMSEKRGFNRITYQHGANQDFRRKAIFFSYF